MRSARSPARWRRSALGRPVRPAIPIRAAELTPLVESSGAHPVRRSARRCACSCRQASTFSRSSPATRRSFRRRSRSTPPAGVTITRDRLSALDRRSCRRHRPAARGVRGRLRHRRPDRRSTAASRQARSTMPGTSALSGLQRHHLLRAADVDDVRGRFKWCRQARAATRARATSFATSSSAPANSHPSRRLHRRRPRRDANAPAARAVGATLDSFAIRGHGRRLHVVQRVPEVHPQRRSRREGAGTLRGPRPARDSRSSCSSAAWR